MTVRENINIPEQDKDFFILLRAGLWQKVEEPLSADPNWEYIYRMACEQTVVGIVSDGICVMGLDDVIPEEWNNQFLEDSVYIVLRNDEINELQFRLCSLFEAENIKFVVLKGQYIAQYYPKPMLRMSGDIDFLIPSESFNKAMDVVTPLCSSIMPGNTKNRHFGFWTGDVPVELHTNLFPRKTGLHKYLQQKQNVMFQSGGFASQFHIPFLFYHILKHLFNAGMGLRQLCDLAVAICRERKDIDISEFRSYLKNTLNSKLWSQVYLFCVHYLGLAEDSDFVFTNVPPRQISHIWTACRDSGNFGVKLNSFEGAGFFGHARSCGQTILNKFSRHWKMNKRKAFGVMCLGISSVLDILYFKVVKS